MNELANLLSPITKFDESDIPGLIELSSSVGWDYDQNEINTIMSSGNVYGHRNQEGRIISSAAIIPYGSHLASIGMVIVNQEYRGLGLGRKATQKCLESIPDHLPAMLIATEDGKPMYEKMGFHCTDYVHKYLCSNYQSIHFSKNIDVTIMPMYKEDLSQVIEIDKDAFGAKREVFLLHRYNQAKEAVVVKNPDGRVVGYGFSVLGPVNLILGPIVAPNTDLAYEIFDQLAKQHQGNLRIDVPSGNEIFMSYVETCGFEKVSQPPIMITNTIELPPRNKTLFGIAAQIFG
ncbi:GNAT family N-acetyltransferase [Brevibacillus laterosporus]|uniref:GNAT family N-acetyltransferase n=1 Tax=Brevibacillus laterosporus TaxID=1465 RepID=A0AAP8QC36_BRELA|nr:GNAT family N-acetyltransferase [Brevibacillus laterosporus]PPA93484.1 GNAT family N-acetyltransferase [Brevibacillus laterosporus]